MKSGRKFSTIEGYALAFGLFLGLCIWKFGNPVILDSKITPPDSAAEFWNDPWPTHWANWILFPIVLAGAALSLSLTQKKLRDATGRGETPGGSQRSKNSAGSRGRSPHQKWLWLLPLFWFGWQLLSATRTVDAGLSRAAL